MILGFVVFSSMEPLLGCTLLYRQRLLYFLVFQEIQMASEVTMIVFYNGCL
jgi:hypothetical protein